jgi:hypothetical protein
MPPTQPAGHAAAGHCGPARRSHGEPESRVPASVRAGARPRPSESLRLLAAGPGGTAAFRSDGLGPRPAAGPGGAGPAGASWSRNGTARAQAQRTPSHWQARAAAAA